MPGDDDAVADEPLSDDDDLIDVLDDDDDLGSDAEREAIDEDQPHRGVEVPAPGR